MDLSLSPEQDQLVDAFAGLYAKHSTPEHVRAAEALGFDPELWKRLADLGAVPMAVAEADGGWGASFLDLALVAEQQGRFVAAAPIIERQGCTLVGLALTNLADHDAVQLSLPFDARSSGALDAVLDELRGRYGASAVTRATQLGRDLGLSMPVLPD